MWWSFFLGLMFTVAASRDTYERIGYFWHITDIHYHADFNQHGEGKKGCWRSDYEGNSGSRASRRPIGPYGDYSCDAPMKLIKSAVKTMMSRHNDNVEFVLWTGDALSHTAKRLPENRQLSMLQELTDKLMQTFSSQFVFPALGHDDPSSRKELGRMWSRWLPTDSMHRFETGGYYMIERKMSKLQIVVLNTNLMTNETSSESKEQWDWLELVLQKFQKNGETVYIVGHMAPGSDERQKGVPIPNSGTHAAYANKHNEKYLDVVRKYSDIIVGQFFGHLHSDTFRVIYSNTGRPISWAMLSPSITPRRSHDGPNNPGLRIYKFDKDTGKVLDYTQYYLDLSTANLNMELEAEWTIEYNFSSYYGINEITPNTLHNLADKISSSNSNDYFNRYYRANSVRMYNNPHTGCDANCAHNHYCAITRVDYQEFQSCLKAAASALASSTASPSPATIYSFIVFITTIIYVIIHV